MNKYKRVLSTMVGSWVVFMLLMVFGPLLSPSYAELVIQTIPQDDQLREKGIIILCPPQEAEEPGFCEEPNWFPCVDNDDAIRVLGTPDIIGFPVCVSSDTDFHAEYKIDIRKNGVNVNADIECIVLEKDVCRSGFGEGTIIKDVTDFFTCKFRQDGIILDFLELTTIACPPARKSHPLLVTGSIRLTSSPQYSARDSHILSLLTLYTHLQAVRTPRYGKGSSSMVAPRLYVRSAFLIFLNPAGSSGIVEYLND